MPQEKGEEAVRSEPTSVDDMVLQSEPRSPRQQREKDNLRKQMAKHFEEFKRQKADAHSQKTNTQWTEGGCP